jgi:hypothetical protein
MLPAQDEAVQDVSVIGRRACYCAGMHATVQGLEIHF